MNCCALFTKLSTALFACCCACCAVSLACCRAPCAAADAVADACRWMLCAVADACCLTDVAVADACPATGDVVASVCVSFELEQAATSATASSTGSTIIAGRAILRIMPFLLSVEIGIPVRILLFTLAHDHYCCMD